VLRQAELDLTAARNQINIWLQRANDTSARNADGFLAALDRGMTDLRGRAAGDGELQAAIDRFLATRSAYARSWAEMQRATADRAAAMQRMDEGGEAMGAALLALPPKSAR
jgi:hypothetical protein